MIAWFVWFLLVVPAVTDQGVKIDGLPPDREALIVLAKPNGDTVTLTGKTDLTGAVTFSYKIKQSDPKGIWPVTITVTVPAGAFGCVGSVTACTVTATTTITVK